MTRERAAAAEPSEPRALREAGRLGLAATGLAIAVLPWYELDEYTPNGWDASWWIRLALLAALIGIVVERLRLAAAAVAVAAIAFRLAVPPDFGFDYDGLDVPTERAFGLYVALATALVALLAELLRARRAPPDPSPGSPRSGTAPEASASGPAGPAPA